MIKCLKDVLRSSIASVTGIMFSVTALGPAIGFYMGAVLLTIYEDPGKAPPGLTSQHTAWVGAWWIGFLIITFLGLLVAYPLLMFPKRLPRANITSSEGKKDITERPSEPPVVKVHIKGNVLHSILRYFLCSLCFYMHFKFNCLCMCKYLFF